MADRAGGMDEESTFFAQHERMNDSQGRIQRVRARSLQHFAAMVDWVPSRLKISSLYEPLTVTMAHRDLGIGVFYWLM